MEAGSENDAQQGPGQGNEQDRLAQGVQLLNIAGAGVADPNSQLLEQLKEAFQRQLDEEKSQLKEAFQRQLEEANRDQHPSLADVPGGPPSDPNGVDGNTELGRFIAVGRVLRNHEPVKSVLDEILRQGNASPSEAFFMAFVLFDGPSGTGKTQLALTLLYFFRDMIRSEFLLMIRATQPIHDEFDARSEMFLKCVHADLGRLSRSPNNDEFSMSKFPTTESLETARFVAKLFGLLGEGEGEKGVTAHDLRRLVLDHNRAGKPLVLFLDEVPTSEPRVVRFVRNLLRRAKVCVVMLGTNATVANMVDAQKKLGGSRGTDQPQHWATVVARFPPLDPGALEATLQSARRALPDHVKSLVDTAQPWMGRLFLSAVEEREGEPLWDDPSTLAALCARVKERVLEGKKRKALFCEGQFCMLLPAYFDHVNETLFTSLVTKHFAYLKVPEEQASLVHLSIVQQQLQHKGGLWTPQGVFPPPTEQPLVPLVLASPPMFAEEFELEDRRFGIQQSVKSVTVARGFALAQSLPPLNTANDKAPSPDGTTLEAVGVAAMVVASHLDGLRGTTGCSFLGALLLHLRDNVDPPTERSVFTLQPPAIQQLLDGVAVPYLAPTNNEWPEWLVQGLKGARLGNVTRPKNDAQVDAQIRIAGQTEAKITAEMKDRNDFKSDVLKQVLERVPLTTELHLVLVRANGLAGTFKALEDKKQDAKQIGWLDFLDELRNKGNSKEKRAENARRADVLRSSAALVRADGVDGNVVKLKPLGEFAPIPENPSVLIVVVPVEAKVLRP